MEFEQHMRDCQIVLKLLCGTPSIEKNKTHIFFIPDIGVRSSNY